MAGDSSDDLLRAGQNRLYPSLTDPNFLVLRSRRVIFSNWIESLRLRQPKVLDVGGRLQPYRALFGGQDGLYLSCDIRQTKLVDVVASGELLPFASGTFDLVICTQVFDYFTHTKLAANEIHRVLKPGGALLMSVPSFAPSFADAEKWRFTRSGILSLLCGFQEVKIAAELHSPASLVRSLNLGLHTLLPSRFLKRCLELTICPILNMLGMMLEALRLTRNEQFAANYSVLAIK
jgi:SAM-dependent methyltransferase